MYPTGASGFASRLFISYSHEDRVFVNRLTLDLKSQNMDVWIDMHEIKGGESVLRAVEEAVLHTDIFVVIVSPNSVNSSWVQNELLMISELVVTEGKVLIPVICETILKSDIPLFLRTRKSIDFTEGYEVALHELVSSLEYWGLQSKDRILDSMIKELEQKIHLSRNELSCGYSAIGKIAIQIGKYNEARAILEKAMEICPSNPDPRHLRGIALAKLARFEDAEGVFRSLASEGPHEQRAFFNLACLYSRWAQVLEHTDDARHDAYLERCFESLSTAFELKIVEWLKNYAGREDPIGELLGDPDLAYAIRASPKVEVFLRSKAKQYDHQWSSRQVYGGGGGCLVEDTGILVETGVMVPIKRILCGDKLISNVSSETKQTSVVWRKIRSVEENGVCINDRLKVTNAQRILTIRGWKEASRLRVGDTLLRLGTETERIYKISRWEGPREVYQLGLQGRPFFVAENIVVHNYKDS